MDAIQVHTGGLGCSAFQSFEEHHPPASRSVNQVGKVLHSLPKHPVQCPVQRGLPGYPPRQDGVVHARRRPPRKVKQSLRYRIVLRPPTTGQVLAAVDTLVSG